jgi:hypothetical protein
LDVAFASSFNNLKIGNTTKIEIEHMLKGKQIKSKQSPPIQSVKILFSCKGRKPRNKKTKGAAKNQ